MLADLVRSDAERDAVGSVTLHDRDRLVEALCVRIVNDADGLGNDSDLVALGSVADPVAEGSVIDADAVPLGSVIDSVPVGSDNDCDAVPNVFDPVAVGSVNDDDIVTDPLHVALRDLLPDTDLLTVADLLYVTLPDLLNVTDPLSVREPLCVADMLRDIVPDFEPDTLRDTE